MVYVFMHNNKFLVYKVERLLRSRGIDDLLVIKEPDEEAQIILIASMPEKQYRDLSDIFISIKKALGLKGMRGISYGIHTACMGQMLEDVSSYEVGMQ